MVNRLNRPYTLLIISVALLLIVAAGALYFGATLEERLQKAVIETFAQIQEETNVTFTYDQIHVKPLSSITVTGIELGFDTDRGLREIAGIERFTISYNLFNFLLAPGRKDIRFDISGMDADLDDLKIPYVGDFASYLLLLFPPVENVYVHAYLDDVEAVYRQEGVFDLHMNLPDGYILYLNQQVQFNAYKPVDLDLQFSEPLQGFKHVTASLQPDLFFASVDDFSLVLPASRFTLDERELLPADITLARTPESQLLTAALQSGEFSADIGYHPDGQYISADYRIDKLNIPSYQQLLGDFGLQQKLPEGALTAEGSLDYDLQTGHLHYRADAQLDQLHIEGLPEPLTLKASLSGDTTHISAESISTEMQGLRIAGNVSADYEDLLRASGRLTAVRIEDEALLIDLSFSHADERLYTQMHTSLVEGLSFEGLTRVSAELIDLDGHLSYGEYRYPVSAGLDIEERSLELTTADKRLRVSASQDGESYTIVGAFDGFDLPLAQLTGGEISDVPADMQVTAYYRSREDWDIRITESRFDSISALGREVDLQGDMVVTPTSALVNNLVVSDSFSTLTGGGSLSYSLKLNPEFTLTAEGSLDLEGEGESYAVSGSYDRGEIGAQVSFERTPLERLQLEGTTGSVDGSAAFQGSRDAFTFSSELRLNDGVLFGSEVEGTVEISADQGSVDIASSSLTVDSQLLEQISFFYDTTSGSMDLQLSTALEMDQRTVTGGIEVSGLTEYRSELSRFSVEQLLEQPLELKAATQGLTVNGEEQEQWTTSAEYFNKTISLVTGADDYIALEMELDTGNFKLSLEKGALPVAMQLQGSFREGQIYAQSDNIELDIELFNQLDIGVIEFTGGKATGKLYVTGSLDDLEYYGELLSNSVTFNSILTTHEHTVSNLYVSLIGKEILFSPFVVETQDLTADAELAFYIDDIIPRSFDVKLSIDRSQMISASQEFDGMRLAYYGGIAGDIHIYGYFDDLSIDGDIFLDRGTVTRPPFEEVVIPENNALTGLNLSIETGKNITGIFPTRDLPIITARVADGERIDIKADLARQRFSVSGGIGVRGGEIVYFQRNFFILDGNINLNLDQNNIDPRISLTARLKDFDNEGNKVDIMLNIENDPVNALSPNFSARPEKTLAEISQILGRNILPTDILGNTDLTAALAFATLATDVIQQVGLIELDPIQELEGSIRNTLNLDLFSIRTMVFQNILLDTIPGEYASSFTRNPVARYLDNTTLMMGKYISDDMFIQAIIQLSIRDDAGVGLFFTNDLGLDIEISYEWDNPLYSLSIAMQPESLSMSQVLDSLSIGVSWSFSL